MAKFVSSVFSRTALDALDVLVQIQGRTEAQLPGDLLHRHADRFGSRFHPGLPSPDVVTRGATPLYPPVAALSTGETAIPDDSTPRAAPLTETAFPG